ncbi:MAG: hypothetical protein BGO49_26225 [Planctomycetales bacterium 71-10]|nr:MAG: hypothetical protein BGO49_26225 [Planctomycetales bacterium 71-10]
MATQLLGRREVLDELEDHLRDEVDALTRAGHPPDEAARAAMDRLGAPSDLGAEFAKVPPTSAPWLPVRLAWVGGALLAASMVLPLWPKLAAGGLASLLATHMGLVMLGYVSTLLVGFLAASYLVARLFAGLADGQVRTLQRAGLSLSALAVALTGVGVAFGFIFCPHEKTGWAFGYDTREVGGLVVLVWNLVMLAGCWAGRRSESPAAMMMLGLVGSMAVVLGWLGATAVEHRLHGAPADFATVAAVVSAQLAVACLAFAPAGCLRRAGA